MENVMCHVRMVVRRSTLAYHNFVFGSAYAISRRYRIDSKKGEDTTGEKQKSRKGQSGKRKDRRGRRKYGKQFAALGVEMVGSWFVR